MIKLRSGVVPEHFNMPWHLALQGRRFEQLGVDVSWRDYAGGSGAMAKALRDGELAAALPLAGAAGSWRACAGGSGAMAKALRDGELDAALLLTEGAVAAVSDGVPLEIISL